jgi:hypothetical protein
VLIRTRGYAGGRSGEDKGNSWLLIKHKDEWAGPLDILEFAPLSVKTPDADLADILAADNPSVWTGNPPAKTGDTGKLFDRIIQQALDIKRGHEAATAPKAAGTATKTAKKTPRAGGAAKGSGAKGKRAR